MPIIKLSELSKLYGFGDAAVIALDEVSLNINDNEFVAVMGPSGCGKSTLMNVIGLLDLPTHGTYTLGSHDVAKLRANQLAKLRRDEIGFVFQSFNLLSRLTVIENVALPLVYRGMSPTRRLKLASSMLERVGMNEREYYLPYQLSGGQAQSAAIARALINEPSIIIADEPTGNLDSASSLLIMELLSEIHKAGTTILMVTHNPELTRYANRVVYMHDGSIVHDERTKFGEVAPTALKRLYHLSRISEEDDLAGVSAIMKALPPRSAKTIKRKRASTRKKKPTAHDSSAKARGQS